MLGLHVHGGVSDDLPASGHANMYWDWTKCMQHIHHQLVPVPPYTRVIKVYMTGNSLNSQLSSNYTLLLTKSGMSAHCLRWQCSSIFHEKVLLCNRESTGEILLCTLYYVPDWLMFNILCTVKKKKYCNSVSHIYLYTLYKTYVNIQNLFF